ncbi:MAG: glycosidase [Akkermansiaceae bacterium]|nr:glycosidase [Akkermansiaceae bacterium]
MKSITIHPTGVEFYPDVLRVLVRPFNPGEEARWDNIISRALGMAEDDVVRELETTRVDFGFRHKAIEQVWMKRFSQISGRIAGADSLSQDRQMFLGALFSHEYSLEAAALFNPSIVAHPDQSGLAEGELRFIMSLRATGEGHISSIEFRTGVVGADYSVKMDAVSGFVTAPEKSKNPKYRKVSFIHKLRELEIGNNCINPVMEKLGPLFSLDELTNAILETSRCKTDAAYNTEHIMNQVHWLAESNYDVAFSDDVPLSERIVFPVSTNESNGIEDARFVRFVDDDGTVTYFATYTAYNGRVILPQLMETEDFHYFKARVLHGSAVQNKGMALFPRRIGEHYAMLSRQDDENLFLMYSDEIHRWSAPILIREPVYPWEYIKIGNCGSPLETPHGWLVITHGVGPMRQYCLGALLLDLDDPTKVIGALPEPLLKPEGHGREGYVPNVVYSCGALIHGDRLILPYGKSDTLTTVVTVELSDLLAAMH